MQEALKIEDSSSLGSERECASELAVVLSTLGKFHSFDLARQLHRHGVLRAIFTGYPSFKLKNEGLPPPAVKTFPWLHAPYMRFSNLAGPLKRQWERQDRLWLDCYVRAQLPTCDVFCGLSGSSLLTAQTAQKRGATYVCDRGSSHIRFQDAILREEFNRHSIPYAGIDPWIIAREEAEYQLADVITVPSRFAADTFSQMGVPAVKVRVVPYGVDLSRFHPVTKPKDNNFQVLFVGNLSLRKGLPYLVKAFDSVQQDRKHLTLIGTTSSEVTKMLVPLSSRRDVSILGPVPQDQLKKHFSESHVMVLPSIEEGLALVQAQAMACGCPVISSTNTGAEDLFTDGCEGFITPIRDVQALAARLQYLADNPHRRAQMSASALQRVRSIAGWDRYGQQMHSLFQGTRN